jgi:hypothetical protein
MLIGRVACSWDTLNALRTKVVSQNPVNLIRAFEMSRHAVRCANLAVFGHPASQLPMLGSNQ